MTKKLLYGFLAVYFAFNISSCALVQKPIDARSGLGDNLKSIEECIRAEDWENAKIYLDKSQETWKKIKPYFQVDIDHDYVNDIESDFTKLSGYIDANSKAESLGAILLIQKTWENIGNL